MDGQYYAVDPRLEQDWQQENDDQELDDGKQKKKRNRKPVTCAQCRKRKLKCDRNEPCKPCMDRGEGHLCDWSEAKRASPKPRGSSGPAAISGHLPPSTGGEGSELRVQLDRLELIIDNLQASASGMMRPPSPPMDPLASLWSGGRSDHHRPGAADALKLLAGAATQLGGTDRPPYEAFAPHIEYNSLDELIGALPYQAELDVMVQRFADSELVSFPIMLGSELKKRVERFDRLSVDTDPCFVALLLAIALFETWYMTTNPRSIVRKESTIASYIKACRAALERDAYLERPSLDALRTLLILHRFHLFSERASNRILLGQAFQLAQSLGLDTERRIEEVDELSQDDTQERRRLWSWMISEDYCRWSDRHYIISPIHYNTELPLNNADGQTQAQMAFGSAMPGTQETVVQHLLFRSSIAGIARLITDRAYSLQSKPTWAQLCDVERDLRRIEASINATLQVSWAGSGIAVLPEGSTPLVFDRYIILLELKQQYIRLFRPFLTRGLRHDTFSAGRGFVLEAARYILAIHRAVAQDQTALRSWLLQHHVLNAMIILALEIFQDSKGSSSAACEVEVQGSLRIFEDRGSPSPLTKDVIAIVKRLMQGPRPKVDSRKRDRDAFEGTTSHIGSDAADLAFLLSGNASNSFSFAGGPSNDHGHGFDGSNGSPFQQHQNPMRPLDPNQTFTKPLPVPMSADPFVSPATLTADDLESDAAFEALWLGVLKHKAMYAVPDLQEWRELSRNGSDAWRGGIDILT